MTSSTPDGSSLSNLIIESETNYTSTPAKGEADRTNLSGGHPGKRSTFPHLFGTPGTTSSIPHHVDLSSSFAPGDHYVEPLSKQYSPAEVAWDSGYYGTFDSPARNNPNPSALSETLKTWESFASPVLNMRTRLAGRPSFLDTSPRKGPLGKVTPRQVLASLLLVLSTISCLIVLFYLTDFGDKEIVFEEKHGFRSIFGWSKINGLNSKLGGLSLDYPDDPQFRGSFTANFDDSSIGMESDPNQVKNKSKNKDVNFETISLDVKLNEDEVNLEPLVLGDAQISGEREEHLKNSILEERKREMLDERRKKMWEKSELLRAKIAEERKERISEDRKKNMKKERLFQEEITR